MFEGFKLSMLDTGEAVIRVRHGGSGPPLLLLHGHPQNHVMWHKIAPRLAEEFTVVAPDLRGYGDSSKPPTTEDHAPYSKRALARDQVSVMQQLGFEHFCVAGHDRGAYVAFRLALDYPEKVTKLAILGAIPIADALRRTNATFALGWWHWFFFAQPYDMPERMIGADPDYFYWKRHRPDRPPYYTPEAFEEYRRCWNNPETIHGFCEEYRAGVTIDREHDEADYGKKRLSCPMLLLWGKQDDFEEMFGDGVAIWRAWADDVRGLALDCGHRMAEEAPDETYEALHSFFVTPSSRGSL